METKSNHGFNLSINLNLKDPTRGRGTCKKNEDAAAEVFVAGRENLPAKTIDYLVYLPNCSDQLLLPSRRLFFFAFFWHQFYSIISISLKIRKIYSKSKYYGSKSQLEVFYGSL